MKKLTPRARNLRRDQTDAERKLWARLKARQVAGAKFRRQHVIGPYIADFCCPERAIIVELDGKQHLERGEYDQRRSAFLARRGYQVLRFWDDEVLKTLDVILERIFDAVTHPHPNPLPPGEGEGWSSGLSPQNDERWVTSSAPQGESSAAHLSVPLPLGGRGEG